MDGSLHAKHVNSAEASNSSIVTDANWIALESPELTSKPNLFPVRPSSEPVDTNVASKEQVQNFIQTVCNTPPEQLSSGCEADVTVSTVLSAHTQMSLDSKTGQIPLLSQPESFNFSTTEDQFKATVSSKTATQSSTPVQSSMKSAQLSGCTSFTTVHISQTEYRSSPDSGSEYVADLEMPIHECRPTSPESAVSLPIDSPISFDYHYRSDSLDSCALMAEIRASSPESVASGTDQVLLSPDSPLPDFRPLSPLPPVCEHETPVFTVYVEECRTSGGTGNEQYSSMHVSDTQFIPRTSYLMVFDETNRPISPGSMIEFRSVTPESNESLSSVSFHSESLDRETSPEKGSEYDHWSNADILIDMPSSPEATGSLNEYISLSLDSPVPSFTPEVFDFLGHVKEYLSSSSQSEISDVDPELSLEWLFEGRQSSPESVVSVNEWMVLSPDSPLPSFVQNVCQLAMPTKECRSVSPETDFSDREYDFVPPVVSPLESRPSSPESLASVHEHRPLSPDSPIPHCTSAVCELHTSVGGYISNSPESDLSDRDYRPISPIAVLSEDRPSSPELVSSVNVHRPFSSYSPVPAYRQTMSDYDISLIQKPPSLEMGLSDIVCSSFDPKVPQSALKTQSLESKISETDNSNEIISGSMLSHDSVTDSMILSSRQILKASEKSTENLPKQRSELDVNKQKTDVGYTVKPFISELTNQASCAMNITVVPCTRSSHQEVQDINITAVKQEFGENKVHLPKLSESVVPEHQALFAQPLTSTPIEQSLDSSPTAKYKLVFKHVLNNLMRNIYDPQYKGETFCPKPGVFEYSPSSPNVASSSAIAQGPLYSLPCPKELDSTLTEQYSPVSEPLTKAYKQYSLLVEHCFNSEAIKSEFESHPLSLEPVNEYKPMTPESLIFLEHLRTSSPESTASVDELRALSPDSPVPQYVCMYFEPDMSITGDRSLTPESAITEEEYDMTADQLTVTYCRPSSPQSIASGDRRPLSPDSPIPEFRTSFPESSLPISGYRSCSPDSLCSESIEYENVLGDLFTAEKRPESPDSFVSEVEDRPFSPDSISEYRPRSPESMTLLSDTRGFSPDSVSECRPSSPDSPTPQFSTLLFELVPVIGHRSSSLESLASDTDYDLNVLTDAPSSYRLSSPDSMTMADEFSLLSTDSPIPEFRSSFPETVLPVSGYRSCSSESVSSESTEYDGVLEDFVTAEQRPESPDSFVLDVEDRPLSPDSIPEYRPISPESMSSPSDTRGSSPDSVSEYRPLSPDSPIPHYSTLMLYEVVPVIRHRSSSLESLASDTDYDLGVFTDMAFCHRSSSPDSIASANESRPLSPDSPVPEFRISFTESSLPVSGYRPCSPESVCSESTKYECFLGDLFTVDQRPESPDSVSECRPLSPDSPIPQYSALLHEVAPFIGHRWSSLESLASDTDYKLNVVTDAASYQRPSSPDSMASVGESRPLSPDSPVPEFRSSFPDNAIPVSGYRSCSPDSVCSEPTEYESCFEECITLEERPESQDSFVSEVEDRPLSPDSIPEYRPMSPGSINFLSDIRGSSPDFVSRSSSLSPDSPIPQYSALLCELVPVIGHRSSSLESLASDTDYDLGDLGDFTDEAFCQRPSSPDSMASANKNRPLSPDSPVPEFRTAFPECSLPVSGYRPCSPESVCSESTKYECFLGDLFTVDQRPESPDSVSECRPLSPDSPIPQYSALLHEVAPFIGHRWSSLESLASDTDYELNVVTDAASYQRPSSPDSMASVGESRPLSPDSPVPEFRSSFPDNAIPVSGYRSCSPDSVCSEPTEYESCFEECFTLEERPESPDSFVSEVEDRPLSPDSIPEYRPMSPGSMNFLSDIRGSSPDFVSRSSSLSPDSPIPQYSALLCELVPVIGHRSSSLESLASDTDYDLGDLGDFTDEAFCQRPSSPDSMASANKNRPLSPDSPVPEFRTAFPECSLPVSGYRPCSPESVCSESTKYECFLGDLFTVDQRPESPDSVSECRPLSPDSPIPQYSALLHEVAPFIGHRWSSLESLASDTDYELNVVTDAASYQRPSSPDSMASVGESRPLSPDSPVPEFRSSFPDNAIPVSGYRSCSPDSVCSEPTEYESCFEECFTLEERPESPDSFVSEVEDRPLSPDSIPEYRPMSPGSINFLSDIRGSSPDFVSRSSSLSPDSPIPQYSALLCELVPVIGHRSSSLESLASDTDYDLGDLGDFTDEAFCHRSSSPDSMASANESRPLSPDSPVPEFRRAFPESSLPVSGYRPCSPEFVCSESTEYECFLGDLFTVDQRPESPDSVSKHRQMSPDSPILQYSTLFCELVPVIQHRSSSLESLASDTDYDLGVFTDEAFCHRSSSPDSMASANENRPLSPDSPVPEFRTAFPERSLPVTGYRSCSPMSVCSESTEYECFLGDLFTVEQRPVSPDSVGSLNQSRSLSPDSPIPEFRSSFPENTLTFSGYESCRLRPAISEKKCDLDIFGTSSPDATQSVNEHQPPSLDSPISMFERMKQDAVASLEDRQLSQSQTVITNVTPVPVKDIDLSKSENQTASETMTSHLFQEAVKMVPEYKLVYKAIPFNLRSNIYDPQYKGETYSPKTGVFEYTGCRMEVVQTCKMDKPHGIIDQDDYKVPSAALGTSQITKCSHKSLTISHEYNNQTSDERIKEKSDSLILDSDIRPESPESVTSETWGKDFVEKTSPALIVFLDKVVKQGNTPHGARDVALLHTEQCGSQTETISEPDYTNSEPPAGFQRPFSEDLNSESKPLATCHEFVLEPEQGTKNTEADSANMEVKRTSVDEVCKVLISTQEDSHGMRMAKQELEFQDKQDLEDKSDYATQLACQQTKARALQELSEKDISFRAQHIEGLTLNQGDSYSTTLLRDATDNEDSSSTVQDSSNVAILEQRLKLTASPSTSDAIESPASDPKTLPSIQERNTSLSSDLESVHHKPFKQSLEQAKTTSELYQIHTAPFQFYMQESHRTVTPNLSSSTSPILRFDYAPPDYTDVLSKSPGSVVSPTDMSPLSPVFNESFSDQAQSTDLPLSTGNEPARTIGSFQLSPGFQQVLSEFENTLAALHKTSTRTALAPSSKEVTHELEVSEQSTEPMDDIRLMGFDLKAKPLSVHADSLESDPEFFECLQTFSDISEPEIRSGELLDVPGAIYQVEEPSSLPSTPDFDCLTGTLKRKECTHEEKEDRQRPISWDSEELDLPIVLEPEDEYVGEHGEAYPYGYADEHSFAEELPPREEAQFDDDDSLGRDIAEELGLLSDSSEEEVLTTRVVRRRVIIQGDDIPEIPPQTVTEEQYTDEYGNIVVKKITRKIIRKYVSADGVEREEVMVEGGQQEAITVDEADSFSKVVKRTVVRSGGDQTEVTFSEPLPVGGAAASEFEVEPVHGRKVSKVIKTMVVQGERMEKQIGDPLLSADLPSAKDDFEKALSYVGGFEKVNLPHLVEKEMVKEDGSVVRRTCMRKTRTQKKTVAKDGQSKHTHLEQLEDTPEALRPDALQQHLHQLLQRYCTPEVTEEPELVAVAEDEGKREEKQDTNDKFSTA
ncbi:ankyrin-2b isoform X12 [Pygocentrus nattereri]|uniref:ankyrin-2b isoform X12 n=1 Tax=Pygocentrus nattereri TaxID=42514 RepID=UPI0018911E39|nr:ankyrin-2b isoform X12 [Pygocentrus nattereri]